jgi:hypothetical protein
MANGVALYLLASWLALCPDNDISGGRVLWRACAECTIERGTYFDWPPILYVTTRLCWETIFAE